MAKKFIKRFLPNPNKVKDNKYLRLFGTLLNEPNLWHLNRHGVATAVSIGFFVAYIPLPGHMLLAAFLAILFRANLALSTLLVWVVNPLTMIPMFGFAYTLGAALLETSLQDLNFESWEVLFDVWQPLLLGCFICGAFLAIAGNISVRLFWRYSVAKSWRKRVQRRNVATSEL